MNEQWKCFHCGETFTNRECAKKHFGVYEYSDPACQIDIAKYREMEELHARNLAEDTERDRVIYRLQAELTVKMRQEEENGYARGLRDAAQRTTAEVEAHAFFEAYLDQLDPVVQRHVRALLGGRRSH